MVKSILATIFCLFISISVAKAQFDGGPLITLGIGTGVSDHAGSYTVQEFFRTKVFSGYRIVTFEARVGWNFWDLVSPYVVGRVSPANTPVSPYRSTYGGFGLAAAIPFARSIYLTGNYGAYNSSLGQGIKVGSGNLYNIGVGYRIGDQFFFELNNTFGNLSDIDPAIDISSEENQIFGMLSFKF